MEFEAKYFNELSASELYEILKSRSEIFLLEQRIICQDMDDADYDSLHCFMTDGKRVVAYLRAFPEKDNKECVVMGRILTLVHKKGTGTKLMKKSIEVVKHQFNAERIHIHAQKQAVGFYEKMGFKIISDEFLEEGVVHVTMEMDLQ